MADDRSNRVKSKTPTFSVSEFEREALRYCTYLSGYNKQIYILNRVTGKEIVVAGTPKVYIALKREMDSVIEKLRSIPDGESIDDSLIDRINTIKIIFNGMKEE